MTLWVEARHARVARGSMSIHVNVRHHGEVDKEASDAKH